MICLNNIVQIFNLPVCKIIRAFAFGIELGNRYAISWSLVGVDDGWLLLVLNPFRALPRKRFAALALRVGDK